MGSPIATKTPGFICFAFPDVCQTLVGTATVPIPYPNIGELGQAQDTSESAQVFAGGNPIILENSKIPISTGDEAGALGSVGGKEPGTIKGEVEFASASSSVYVNNKRVVRMFDSTTQNKGNAVGTVLGGFPTVFVGG